MAEITVTKDNFENEVIKSDIPVILDFWATWCGPCRMLSPVLEEIDRDYAGKIKIGKINVDDEPELAASFGVASIPMLFLMKDGKAAATSVGYRTREQLEKGFLTSL